MAGMKRCISNRADLLDERSSVRLEEQLLPDRTTRDLLINQFAILKESFRDQLVLTVGALTTTRSRRSFEAGDVLRSFCRSPSIVMRMPCACSMPAAIAGATVVAPELHDADAIPTRNLSARSGVSRLPSSTNTISNGFLMALTIAACMRSMFSSSL